MNKDEKKELCEDKIVDLVTDYLTTKKRGSWKKETAEQKKGHLKGVDIAIRGGQKNSEYYYIECKGKSYAKKERSRKAIDSEGWLVGLGQLVTRMQVKPNKAYKYGLGLYWKGAQVALRRIPRKIADALELHIFAVNDDKVVKEFTPQDFGKEEYPDELFK